MSELRGLPDGPYRAMLHGLLQGFIRFGVVLFLGFRLGNEEEFRD